MAHSKTNKPLFSPENPAILALSNGQIFQGISIGSAGVTTGELVFNTAMSGYQEILSDPSYAEQIVTFTTPHIGNVGVNSDDQESYHIHAAGVVIRESSPVTSNWRARQSFTEYLKTQGIVAIAGVDTRALTRLLRDQGALNATISTDTHDIEHALRLARSYPGLENIDLAKRVTTHRIKSWSTGSLQPDSSIITPEQQPHIVAYDYGIKHNMLRLLKDQGCRLTVVPADMPANEVIALKPDGVLLSNGPGDPAACFYAITNIQYLLDHDVPLLGICLGCQLLALACGAKTKKMAFGHHGANHPVSCLKTHTVSITSQNHGFCIDEQQLPDQLTITHRSLFDNTIQGIAHQHKPAFGFQGHPEASPGPHDAMPLFTQFIQRIQENYAAKN